MTSHLVTYSERKAHALINSRSMTATGSGLDEFRKAGDEIIALAEQIKVERQNAILGMLTGVWNDLRRESSKRADASGRRNGSPVLCKVAGEWADIGNPPICASLRGGAGALAGSLLPKRRSCQA